MYYLLNSKINLLSSSIIFLLLLSNSCSRSNSKKESQITPFIVDSVYLPVDYNTFLKDGIRYVNNGIITYLTEKDFKLIFYNIESEKVISEYSLEKYRTRFECYCPISKDSIYLQLNNNTIELLNNANHTTISLDSIVKSIDSQSYTACLTHHMTIHENKMNISLASTRNDCNYPETKNISNRL